MSLPRQIARAVFLGLGTVALLLTFAPLIADQDFRGVMTRYDWSSKEFQALAKGLGYGITSGIIFLLAGFSLKTARLSGLMILTICNLLFLVLIWPAADGKSLAVAIPLCLSLLALLAEDLRILTKMRTEQA